MWFPPFPLKEGPRGFRAEGDKMEKNFIMFHRTAAFLLTLALTLQLSLSSQAGEKKPVTPAPKDKCPVCGMFVVKYPEWMAEVIYKDGSYAVFDGPKDLFKYYLNLKKYNPAKKITDIDSVFVKDYYSVNFLDGTRCLYVAGSDIYGPMGRELIPFEKEADAREFMKDHKGESLLRFTDITEKILKTLD